MIPESPIGKEPSPVHVPTTVSAHELAERAQLALEAASVGTWSWDIIPDSLVWDDVTHHLFGVKLGEFSGARADMEKLIHPADRERVCAAVAQCVATGDGFQSEYRVIWPGDLSIHHLRARGKMYCDETGRSLRMTGACWDISERKAVEEELARERFLLRTLGEHLPDSLYFKDRDSRFIWVSRKMQEQFSVQGPAGLIGKTDFDFFREEHARSAFDDEQRIIVTGQPLVNLEEREVWPDGRETWVSSTKMPLRDGAGQIVGTFGLSRDITARKLAEDQLAKYAEELRRKNTELEEDLGMARELQNALMPRRYPSFPAAAATRDSALHFSHFFNASTSMSGDFFDILELSDTTAGIFICDVMGHGVRAALVAAIVRALVSELKGIGDQPGAFLEKLNAKLSGILKHTDIPMFASASYVVTDLARGELRYANAGHPDPLRVQPAAGRGAASRLNQNKRGPVLGMFGEAKYETSRSNLSVHDMVLLFTDGLFEVESSGGEFYDQQCLMRAVNRRAHLTADDLCREVMTEIQEFSATQHFTDDVCLVAMEVERLGL